MSNAETFWAEATILKGDTESLKGDKLRSAGIDVCLWEINKACETFIYSVLVILSSKSPSEVNAEIMAVSRLLVDAHNLTEWAIYYGDGDLPNAPQQDDGYSCGVSHRSLTVHFYCDHSIHTNALFRFSYL